MNDPWHAVSLRGVFDSHVHTAPDVRPRWHTALELADLAQAAGMAGFVIKSHHESTVGRAAEVRKHFPELKVYGGITLNRACGGLDSRVVERELAAGARIVWLPTLDGRGQDPESGLAVIDSSGVVISELRRVFERLAAADAVLATGHISVDEVLPVVQFARRDGVRRILVNHPEIPFLNLPVDLQRQLSQEGALLERCYPRPEAPRGFDDVADAMCQVGPESTVIATDLGRTDLPGPLAGLRRLIFELQQRGVDQHQIAAATRDRPRGLFEPGGGERLEVVRE
jgi:hypothetical protein